MKRYVVGFMINREAQLVLMIRKNRPEFQKGKWNGIGGKIEPGETPLTAMVREFEEESGVRTTPERWQHTLTMTGHDFTVYYFRYFVDENDYYDYKSVTDELVSVKGLEDIFDREQPLPTLNNTRWIVAFQFTESPFDFPIIIPYLGRDAANVDDGSTDNIRRRTQ